MHLDVDVVIRVGGWRLILLFHVGKKVDEKLDKGAPQEGEEEVDKRVVGYNNAVDKGDKHEGGGAENVVDAHAESALARLLAALVETRPKDDGKAQRDQGRP